jgi:hypothetical protein
MARWQPDGWDVRVRIGVLTPGVVTLTGLGRIEANSAA